jgi:hypothetical protein
MLSKRVNKQIKFNTLASNDLPDNTLIMEYSCHVTDDVEPEYRTLSSKNTINITRKAIKNNFKDYCPKSLAKITDIISHGNSVGLTHIPYCKFVKRMTLEFMLITELPEGLDSLSCLSIIGSKNIKKIPVYPKLKILCCCGTNIKIPILPSLKRLCCNLNPNFKELEIRNIHDYREKVLKKYNIIVLLLIEGVMPNDLLRKLYCFL